MSPGKTLPQVLVVTSPRRGRGELLMPQAAVFEYLSPAERGRGAPNNPEKYLFLNLSFSINFAYVLNG